MTDPPRLNDEHWQQLKGSGLEGSYDLAAIKARVVATAAGAGVGVGAAGVGSVVVKAGVAACMVIGATIGVVALSRPAPSTASLVSLPSPSMPSMEQQASTVIEPPTKPAPSIAESPAESPAVVRVRRASRATNAAAVPAFPAAPAPSPATSIAAPSTLPAELAAYDEAVAALAAGRADDAHAALQLHRERWPTSVLRPEVDLSDLEALLRAGRDEEARALAAILVDDVRLRARRGEIQRLLNRKASVAGDSVGGGLQ